MGALIWIAASAAALAVAGLSFGIWSLTAGRDRRAADRLGQLTGLNEDEARAAPRQRLPGLAQTAARLSASTDEAEIGALRTRLTQAGYRARNAAEWYSAARTIAGVVSAILLALVVPTYSPLWILGGALIGATIGYYLPWLIVTNALQKRQSALLKSFPDAMDLLVSCVEAGLGVDSAMRRVADEIELSAPELARELQLVTHETNAGIPRVEALRRLGQRTGVPELISLANVLIQAERFGTPVARALRLHSEGVRVRRMQRAEGNAAQVSPKLTVVMICFVLPCLIVVLVGPAMVNVKNILLPTLAGAGE
jgi:tight adherence protein C